MEKIENRPAETDKNGNAQNSDNFTSVGKMVTYKFPVQAFPDLSAGEMPGRDRQPPIPTPLQPVI